MDFIWYYIIRFDITMVNLPMFLLESGPCHAMSCLSVMSGRNLLMSSACQESGWAGPRSWQDSTCAYWFWIECFGSCYIKCQGSLVGRLPSVPKKAWFSWKVAKCSKKNLCRKFVQPVPRHTFSLRLPLNCWALAV
jgi:hypothetical protein